MAWSTSDHRPIEERWQQASAQLISLGLQPPYPISETNYANMLVQIRQRAPVLRDDPLFREASRELSNLENRYRSAWREIRDLQNKLRRSVDSDVHRLLGDVPTNWAHDFPDADGFGLNNCTSNSEARQAIQAMLPHVLAIEGFRSQLSDAVTIDKEVPETLHRRLIFALFAQHEQVHERLRLEVRRNDILNQQVAALTGKIDKLHNKRRSK
jgi:hypothetical protein